MKFTIDRFEGDKAILEDENKQMHFISKSAIDGLGEGDVICIVKDEGETAAREKRIKSLADELFK